MIIIAVTLIYKQFVYEMCLYKVELCDMIKQDGYWYAAYNEKNYFIDF